MKVSAMFAATALVLSIGAGSAVAQQEGLVNLNVEDTQVTVPVGIAAQVCGTNVEALQIQDDVDGNPTVTGDCDVTQSSLAENQAYQNFQNSSAGGQGKENAPGQEKKTN